MKKILKLSFFIFLFFLNVSKVLAFSGRYNYEVTNLSYDDGNISISGWAIPNAGVADKDQKSPKLDKDLGSGYYSGKCTTNNKNNKYQYTLYAIPLTDDKKLYTPAKVNYVQLGNSQYGNNSVNLTDVMCKRDSKNNCDADKSSCYQNVGWSFKFNEKTIQGEQFKNGYALYLEVSPTGRKNATVGFPLIVYENKIKNFGNTISYSNGEKKYKVKVIAYDGYYQNCGGSSCSRYIENKKKTSKQFDNGKTYEVSSTFNYKKQGQTYYKVYESSVKDYVYIPASWVAPPDNYAIILPPPNSPRDVSRCTEKSKQQNPEDKVIESCSGHDSFEGGNDSSCSVTNFTYYTRKCEEKLEDVSLNINGLEDGTKVFSLNNGGGFTASAKITTTYTCEYTFDIEHFKENYNNVLNNLAYYEEESEDWYTNSRIKTENLDPVLENYINQTKNIDTWNSNYDLANLNPVLKVNNDSMSLVSNGSIKEQIDLNDDSTIDNYCIVVSSGTLTLDDGQSYTINNVKCGEKQSIEFSLPKNCLNTTTGSIDKDCKDINNQINGSNKYYVPLNLEEALNLEDGVPVQLEINNLGYDGNWSISLSECNFKIYNGPINREVVFRQIELADPFIKTYDLGRGVGRNYLNNKYDFQDIIKADTWKQNFEYRYTLSKDDIRKIRKDTSEEGVSSYLGKNCYFRTLDKKYICDFVRNRSENGSELGLFTRVEFEE